MSKKTICPAAGVLLAAAATVACAQQAAAPAAAVPPPTTVVGPTAPHWYGGAALGQTIQDLPPEAVPIAGTSSAAGTSSLNAGHNRSGFKVFTGYRLHRNFALEAAYTDYGVFAATRFVTGSADGRLKASMKITGFSLEGLGILPFESGFSLYAKLGALYALSDTTFSPEGGVAGPDKRNPTSRQLTVKTGIGAGYLLTERLSLRLEYEVAKKVGEENTVEADIKALFAGLQYRF
jgi:opacity protein-like surface antigen